MTKVYCFSATGRTLGLARALAQKLSCGLEEFPIQRKTEPPDCQTAVVVFPVYCQSVPLPVKRCLPLIAAENMVLIAVYGRKSCGNALHEAARLTGSRVIAGAYVPTGHTYLNEPAETDLALLEPVLARIAQPCAVRIPWRFKNPLAAIFPRRRARVGVRIHVSESCACICSGFAAYSCHKTFGNRKTDERLLHNRERRSSVFSDKKGDYARESTIRRQRSG